MTQPAIKTAPAGAVFYGAPGTVRSGFRGPVWLTIVQG